MGLTRRQYFDCDQMLLRGIVPHTAVWEYRFTFIYQARCGGGMVVRVSGIKGRKVAVTFLC